MPGSDWYTRSAHWIAGLVILAVACFLGYFVLRDAAYNRAYKEAQAQYAAAEADRQLYEDCMALGAAEKVLSCLRDKIEPGRETQRAEDDLQAQKDMADATWGMLIISAVIGFSSIGVAVWVGLFVRDTLAETQNTNRIAREAVELDHRAWLKVDVKVERMRIVNQKLDIFFGIRMENIGNSVASNVVYVIKDIHVSRANMIDIRKEAKLFYDQVLTEVSDDEHFANFIIPNDVVKENASRKLNVTIPENASISPSLISVAYSVAYKSRAIDGFGQTSGCLLIGIVKEPSRSDAGELEFKGADLQIGDLSSCRSAR